MPFQKSTGSMEPVEPVLTTVLFDKSEDFKHFSKSRGLKTFKKNSMMKKNVLRQYTYYGSGLSLAQVQQVPLNLSILGKGIMEPVKLPR